VPNGVKTWLTSNVTLLRRSMYGSEKLLNFGGHVCKRRWNKQTRQKISELFRSKRRGVSTHVIALSTTNEPHSPGLPDFSWCNIPKWEKILINHKIYQIAPKYTK
jgi:hypothetical protein